MGPSWHYAAAIDADTDDVDAAALTALPEPVTVGDPARPQTELFDARVVAFDEHTYWSPGVHARVQTLDGATVLAMRTRNTMMVLHQWWLRDHFVQMMTDEHPNTFQQFLPCTLEMLQADDANAALRLIWIAERMMSRIRVAPWAEERLRVAMQSLLKRIQTPSVDKPVDEPVDEPAQEPYWPGVGIVHAPLWCCRSKPVVEIDDPVVQLTDRALAFKAADGAFGVTNDGGRTQILSGVEKYNRMIDGELIGYKLALEPGATTRRRRWSVVILAIPPDARSTFVPDADNLKFRCDRAAVLAILPINDSGAVFDVPQDRAVSQHDSAYVYRVGVDHFPDRYDPDPATQCGNGLHFTATLDGLKMYAKRHLHTVITDVTVVRTHVQRRLNARHVTTEV